MKKKNEASFVRICLHNSSNENAVVVSVQKKCSARIASAQRGFERMSSFLAQFPYFHTFTKRGHIVADESHAACYLRTLNNGTNNNCRRSPEGRKQRAIERDTLEAVKIALFSDSQFVIVCVCVFMYVVICCEIFIVIGFMLDARVFMINFSKHIGLNLFTKRRKTSRIASMVNNSFNFVNMLATNAHHISTSKHSGLYISKAWELDM